MVRPLGSGLASPARAGPFLLWAIKFNCNEKNESQPQTSEGQLPYKLTSIHFYIHMKGLVLCWSAHGAVMGVLGNQRLATTSTIVGY